MTDDDTRMRTTHVGSLVRPDELVAYLRKIDAGEEYDRAAYEECLARSVAEVVQAQRDAGIDIVSDGEYGKSAWNYYVYERLGGIELREHPPGDANFASVNDAPTDWARFPEFYAEYFAKEQEYESPGGDWACVSDVTYTGGDVIARDIANLKAAMDAARVQEGFLPVVAPASVLPESHRRALRLRAGRTAGHRRGAGRGVPRDRRRGAVPPDRRCLHPVHVRRARPAGRRWTTTGHGPAPRIDALNHALEGIPEDRIRYHVCWGSWNGPHTNDIAAAATSSTWCFQVNAGAYLDRERQPAPRARVARMGGRRAARRARCSSRA